MENTNLYAVLLNGKICKNHLMEDHHLVFVIAKDEKAARVLVKKKWNAEDIHIDSTQKLSIIDGYKINLEKVEKQSDDFQINPEYSE